MPIYRFSSTEGIPVPPEGPETSSEAFRLLAINDIGPILLEQEAEYPLDLTPSHVDDLKYSLTVTDDSNAHLDIQSICDDQANGDESWVDNFHRIAIPADEPLVPIVDEDPQGEPRMYEVIAILPPGIDNPSE